MKQYLVIEEHVYDMEKREREKKKNIIPLNFYNCLLFINKPTKETTYDLRSEAAQNYDEILYNLN